MDDEAEELIVEEMVFFFLQLHPVDSIAHENCSWPHLCPHRHDCGAGCRYDQGRLARPCIRVPSKPLVAGQKYPRQSPEGV